MLFQEPLNQSPLLHAAASSPDQERDLPTGNAWVHPGAFRTVSPHVTVDTRLIVAYFRFR
jgi:hypothetical protein